MVLRIQTKTDNQIFKVYLLAMFALMAVRYLLKVDVPAVAFLLVAMLPIWWGNTSEQLAFAASCIPLSIAFQYKYALLILAAAILIKNHWRIKMNGAFIVVMAMMVWELWHAFYGQFSFVEYLRDFAELILLAIVTSIDMRNVDHKLVIRSLAISVVGVCVIMLVMQMQQFGFDLVAVFSRSAHSFRFGQSNMASGRFAINFNANNLGFICNLATCGSLLLAIRKEHLRIDIILAICTVIFAMMTLSRSAIICVIMIFAAYLLLNDGKLSTKIWSCLGGLVIVLLALILVHYFVPTVFENILERFQRKDVWNGRGGLFKYYNHFLFMSPMYFLFGIGMQSIYEKVVPHSPVAGVPHMGLQEVWVAWGVVGFVMLGILIWKVISSSKLYSDGKRQPYQFMPLVLTLVFTMSGQLITSSRALMAFTFAYVCLCIKRTVLRTENI